MGLQTLLEKGLAVAGLAEWGKALGAVNGAPRT